MPDGSITNRSVTSTEFQTRAGLYLERAAVGPVIITKYDRPSRVVLDFEEYNRLQALAKARPTRRAVKAAELAPEEIEAIETADYSHIDPELGQLMD